MPKPDLWSRIALVGWVTAGILAAVAVGQWVTITHLPSRPYAQAPQSYTKQYQDKGAVTPPSGSAQEAEPYEAKCHHPKNAEEANLCEQFRVAEAAEKSLALADKQLLFTIFQSFIAAAAAIATAWAAREAGQAARAAAKSIEVSEQAIRASQDAHRAHFHVDVERRQFYSMNVVSIEFFNYGETTASAFEWKCEGAHAPIENVATKNEPTKLNQLIPPNDSHIFPSGYRCASGINNLAGHLKYNDVFGVRRKRGFAFQIIMPKGDISIVGGNAYNYDRVDRDDAS